ncbi:MAG TPA: hypothetical protein VD839_01160 [Burkholderiales bacterium]|nr:hypothetical protein [Burkholderiales bacterium]
MKRKVMLSSLVAAGILTPLAATGARFSEPVVLHAQSSARMRKSTSP